MPPSLEMFATPEITECFRIHFNWIYKITSPKGILWQVYWNQFKFTERKKIKHWITTSLPQLSLMFRGKNEEWSFSGSFGSFGWQFIPPHPLGWMKCIILFYFMGFSPVFQDCDSVNAMNSIYSPETAYCRSLLAVVDQWNRQITEKYFFIQ